MTRRRFRPFVVGLVAATAPCARAVPGEVAFPAPRPEGVAVPVWPEPPRACGTAPVDDPCARRRGPIEVRDDYLLAQPFLTLPATSPDTLGCGATSVRVQAIWSNTFGWGQTQTGEAPDQRHYIVDGETRTVEATVLHGVTEDLDLGVRLPLHWRGAGFTDDAIDAFHEAFAFLGITSNKREDFRTGVFRVHGLRHDGSTFDLGEEKGVGLGNVEGIARWRVLDEGRDGWSAALVGRATFPTGTGPFDVDGVAAGLQLVVARRVSRDVDLFGGIGAVLHGTDRFQGIGLHDVVGHAFLAVEWRVAPRWSLLLETDFATQHVDDVVRFERERWVAMLGAKVDLDASTTLEGGFVENLVDQQSTLDFGLHLGLEHRF